MSNVKTFYDSDIAMMEHELLKEAAITDWRPEDLQMYLAGMQDLASKIIAAIRSGETF